jgi:hypothetical protein
MGPNPYIGQNPNYWPNVNRSHAIRKETETVFGAGATLRPGYSGPVENAAVMSTDVEGNPILAEPVTKAAQPSGQLADAAKVGELTETYGTDVAGQLLRYANYHKQGGLQGDYERTLADPKLAAKRRQEGALAKQKMLKEAWAARAPVADLDRVGQVIGGALTWDGDNYILQLPDGRRRIISDADLDQLYREERIKQIGLMDPTKLGVQLAEVKLPTIAPKPEKLEHVVANGHVYILNSKGETVREIAPRILSPAEKLGLGEGAEVQELKLIGGVMNVVKGRIDNGQIVYDEAPDTVTPLMKGKTDYEVVRNAKGWAVKFIPYVNGKLDPTQAISVSTEPPRTTPHVLPLMEINGQLKIGTATPVQDPETGEWETKIAWQDAPKNAKLARSVTPIFKNMAGFADKPDWHFFYPDKDENGKPILVDGGRVAEQGGEGGAGGATATPATALRASKAGSEEPKWTRHINTIEGLESLAKELMARVQAGGKDGADAQQEILILKGILAERKKAEGATP